MSQSWQQFSGTTATAPTATNLINLLAIINRKQLRQQQIEDGNVVWEQASWRWSKRAIANWRQVRGKMKNIGINWLFPCSLAASLLSRHSGAQQLMLLFFFPPSAFTSVKIQPKLVSSYFLISPDFIVLLPVLNSKFRHLVHVVLMLLHMYSQYLIPIGWGILLNYGENHQIEFIGQAGLFWGVQ